jgi:hypothetical protein
MDPDAVSDWRTHELDARVQIQLTLEEEQLNGVISTIMAKDTWDCILRRLQGEGKHSIALIIGELFCNTLSDETSLKMQLNSMLQLGYNLHALRQTLDDSLITIVMIISLPNCKGTSIHFLTSPLLYYSPPVHMYSPSSPLYHFQGPYLQLTTSRPDHLMTFQKSTH